MESPVATTETQETDTPGDTPTSTGAESPTPTPSPTPTRTPTPIEVPFETPPNLPPATREESPIEEDGPSVSLEPIATGVSQPIAVRDLPGTEGEGTDGYMRFIADKFGTLHVQDDTGVRSEPVLDVSDDLVEREDWETGLIGLALHPEFESNRRYFVRYSAQRREGTPSNYNHTAVLEEYRATEDLRGTVPESRRIIMEIPQPDKWHQSGDIRFGPDGFLYVALGDGGHGSDQGPGHADDWYDAVGGGNGQNVTENLLGSILRIDVDSEDDGKNYGIPADNPLVGTTALSEQYAWGLRNPWRMSFYGGHLFAGDVGQSSYEEVSIITKGGNYGWNVKEGVACFQADDCPDESPRQSLIDPVIAYSHSVGIAVIGGHFYADEEVPAITDRYVFGDVAGPVFAARPPEDGNRLWPVEIVDAGLEDTPLAFGRGLNDELYLLATDSARGTGGNGTVYKFRPTN
jgi:glucose/arabinose dehydrogenase